MNIFPIGLVSNGSSSGVVASITYSMFEPNKSCRSVPLFNILTTKFDQQNILTRKKGEPYKLLTYEYENIYQREYNQIEHFIHQIADGGNTSFHLVDFSQGIQPTSITISGDDWIANIPNTRLFSSVPNRKSSKAFVWTGSLWKEGNIASITTNTSILIDVSNGSLTATEAGDRAYVYPLYEVYIPENAVSGFTTTFYIDGKQYGNNGGWMWSGSLGFTTRYKV